MLFRRWGEWALIFDLIAVYFGSWCDEAALSVESAVVGWWREKLS